MNTEKNKRIEEILSSLDNHPTAAAPDFFYTRLKARMEKGYVPAARRPLLLRPVFAVAALVVIIAVNIFVLLQESSDTQFNIPASADPMQSIAAEYNLNDNNIAYDLTQETK